MAVWPASLPTSPLFDGWSEKAPDLGEKSSVDVGVARKRRRARKGVREMTWPMILTGAQCETLDNFYLNDGATQSFSGLDHPRTGNAMPRARIDELSEYQIVAPDKFFVTMKLEILP